MKPMTRTYLATLADSAQEYILWMEEVIDIAPVNADGDPVMFGSTQYVISGDGQSILRLTIDNMDYCLGDEGIIVSQTTLERHVHECYSTPETAAAARKAKPCQE